MLPNHSIDNKQCRPIDERTAVAWVAGTDLVPVIGGIYNYTCMQSAIESNYPTLNNLERLRPRKAGDWVGAVLSFYNHMFVPRHPLQNAYFNVARDYIVMHYGYFTCEDIVLAIKMGLQGDFAPYYGEIDMGVLRSWMDEYRERFTIFKCTMYD